MRRKRFLILAVLLSAIIMNVFSFAAHAEQMLIACKEYQSRAWYKSNNGNGSEVGDSDSTNHIMSSNGRYIAFSSKARNLLSVYNQNPVDNVYWRDIETGLIKLISSVDGITQGNSYSYPVAISDNGRYVLFNTASTNLSSIDNDSYIDAYRKDTETGELTLVTISSSGEKANEGSDSDGLTADGQGVLFSSFASNLDTRAISGKRQIYFRNLNTGITQLVSVDSTGASSANNDVFSTEIQGISNRGFMTANGSHIFFISQATNIVENSVNGSLQVYGRNMQSAVTELVSMPENGNLADGHITTLHGVNSDGSIVLLGSNQSLDSAFPSSQGFFVKNIATSEVKFVEVDSDGLSVANAPGRNPKLSANGNFVAFDSTATNLDSRDATSLNDVYVFNFSNENTELVSVDTNGQQFSNSNSYTPDISGDGNRIVFINSTSGSNTSSVMVHERSSNRTLTITASRPGTSTLIDMKNKTPIITSDGKRSAFLTKGQQLDYGTLSTYKHYTDYTQDVMMAGLDSDRICQPDLKVKNTLTNRGPERGEITVSWDVQNYNNVTGYKIQYNDSDIPSAWNTGANLGIGSASGTISGLGDNAHPNIRVITKTSDAGEYKTNSLAGYTFSVPETPRSFIAQPGMLTGQIRLDWQVPLDDGGKVISNYNIYTYDPSSRQESLITSTDEETFTYTVSGLIPGNNYYFRIKAVNEIGESVPAYAFSEATLIPVLPLF